MGDGSETVEEEVQWVCRKRDRGCDWVYESGVTEEPGLEAGDSRRHETGERVTGGWERGLTDGQESGSGRGSEVTVGPETDDFEKRVVGNGERRSGDWE